MKKHFSILAAVFTILLASGCLTAQQPAQATTAQKPATHPASRVSVYAPAERITNFDVLKQQLRQYHECTCTCGCYAKDLDHQADRAIAILRARAAHRRPNEKLALVLDIDETSLSNYEEMSKADFAYDSAVFDAWIKSAKAPAIPGTLRLFQEAQRLNVNVFFITGRAESEREATERNLREQGYQNWQQLFMRSPALASQPVYIFKSGARAAIATQGYRMVLNVGDQWSDDKGKPQADFFVKYPDPFYLIP
ncbi:MAG TPA: HAD family acid phosphatase [Terracidiphilus sp.]